MIVTTTKRARPTGTTRPLPPLAADARPLYIAPGAETHVCLDGPALCVQRGEQAEQLFPLRRLSRIHCTEAARWSTEALLACARQGIGVLFVDEVGEVVARLLGHPGGVDDLAGRLLDFLLLPQALGRYEHWRLSSEQRVARWAGARLNVPHGEWEPAACRAHLRARAVRYVGEREEGRCRQWLRGIAHGWMQSHLQDLGLGANTELAQVGAPALARDLSGLMMWYLEPVRLGWLRRRWLAAEDKGEPLRPAVHAEVVRLFESKASRAAHHGREITGSLHRWLIHET